jgi:hypothetical protein
MKNLDKVCLVGVLLAQGTVVFADPPLASGPWGTRNPVASSDAGLDLCQR